MKQSPFQVRGVIEGFYGTFYTFPERNDLIRFMGQHGFNLYVYAPKNDRQHRARWWELYPPGVLDLFAETVRVAEASGVQFCYAISPLNYDPEQDFAKLTRKLESLYDCGIRSFSMLVDDLACAAHDRPNCADCEWPAAPHVDICNQLYEWLVALDASCTLSMCPTIYHGQAPFRSYLHELGAGLDPAIDIFYTGPDICSSHITAVDADAFAAAVQRAPLIWDNYPVNDLAMQPEMHIGPIRGRDATLHRSAKGVVVNTMLQAEASKIPLLTFADYFTDPDGYDPWRSWEHALREIGGPESFEALHRFAENSLDSCLGTDREAKLEHLALAAVAELRCGVPPSGSQAIDQLSHYLNDLDESCYFLKYRMANLALRDNLLPWIEALDGWAWLGKRAVSAVRSMESGVNYERALRELQRQLDEVSRTSKRIGGNAVLPFAKYVLEQAKTQQREHVAAEDHAA